MKTYCSSFIKKIFLLGFIFQFAFSSVAFSQESVSTANRNIKRNIATVLFSSLGGAVLGLSTLSFYGKPQEQTGNITTGALLGFVAGIGYVAFSSSRPKPASYDYTLTDVDSKFRRSSNLLVQNPSTLQVQFEF